MKGVSETVTDISAVSVLSTLPYSTVIVKLFVFITPVIIPSESIVNESGAVNNLNDKLLKDISIMGFKVIYEFIHASTFVWYVTVKLLTILNDILSIFSLTLFEDFIETLNWFTTVGTPLIIPVTGLRVNPSGREPDIISYAVPFDTGVIDTESLTL